MKGCAVAGQRGLCCWVHRDLVLNRFLNTTAGYCITNRLLPTQYEVQKIKVALAVSDPIEGKQPQSLPSNLSGSISNCRICLVNPRPLSRMRSQHLSEFTLLKTNGKKFKFVQYTRKAVPYLPFWWKKTDRSSS